MPVAAIWGKNGPKNKPALAYTFNNEFSMCWEKVGKYYPTTNNDCDMYGIKTKLDVAGIFCVEYSCFHAPYHHSCFQPLRVNFQITEYSLKLYLNFKNTIENLPIVLS